MRTRAELLEQLVEIRGFLDASAASYDGGFEAEAKRLALSLRVLVHDTHKSKSLLAQLKVKDRLDFSDSANPIRPSNLLPTPGLVMMRVEWGREGRYVPLIELGERPLRVKTFPAWWDRPVMNLGDGHTWNRKKLVLTLANEEGGGHVDPMLDEQYERLAKLNGLNWEFVSSPSGVTDPFRGDPVAAAVRQIAHEVQTTMERHAELLV